MNKFVIGVLVLIAGSASAYNFDCKKCAKMAKAAGEYYNDEVLVGELIDYFQNKTCPEIESKGYDKKGICPYTVKAWWPELAKVLFNDVYGWFKVNTWCPELDCDSEEKYEDTDINCFDCLNRMNSQATYFDDGVILADIIYELNYKEQGFCNAAAKETKEKGQELTLDDCRAGMLHYVPRLMRHMKNYPAGDQVHRTFCVEKLQCKAA